MSEKKKSKQVMELENQLMVITDDIEKKREQIQDQLKSTEKGVELLEEFDKLLDAGNKLYEDLQLAIENDNTKTTAQ